MVSVFFSRVEPILEGTLRTCKMVIRFTGETSSILHWLDLRTILVFSFATVAITKTGVHRLLLS
jgi:hypothetical protein